MDPEVVAQFNSLQQTGNYIPSGATGAAGMSSNTGSSSTTGSSTASPLMNSPSDSPTTANGNSAPIQTAVDAFFAVVGTPGFELGL